ncbi:MAG: hypothetical protein E6543_23265, partial [Enterobacter hormaechei]|nr:hypothetical protein [Enterobacter hormaechei]
RSQFRHFHHGAPVLIVTLDNILQQCILFSGERSQFPDLCQDGIAYKYLKTVVTSKKLRPDLIFRYFVVYFRRIPGIICAKCKSPFTLRGRQVRLKGLLSLLKIWQSRKEDELSERRFTH